jgi:hypothetical protein
VVTFERLSARRSLLGQEEAREAEEAIERLYKQLARARVASRRADSEALEAQGDGEAVAAAGGRERRGVGDPKGWREKRHATAMGNPVSVQGGRAGGDPLASSATSSSGTSPRALRLAAPWDRRAPLLKTVESLMESLELLQVEGPCSGRLPSAKRSQGVLK